MWKWRFERPMTFEAITLQWKDGGLGPRPVELATSPEGPWTVPEYPLTIPANRTFWIREMTPADPAPST